MSNNLYELIQDINTEEISSHLNDMDEWTNSWRTEAKRRLADRYRIIRKGKWLLSDDDLIACECSVCRNYFYKGDDDVFGYPFCPKCGASMEEDEPTEDESTIED